MTSDTSNSELDQLDDEEDDDYTELPDQPVTLKCSTRAALFGNWGLFVIWAGISVYLYFEFFRGEVDWQRDWPVYAIFGAIFPGGTLLALVVAVVGTLRWRKYGESSFELPKSSVTVGQELKGTFRTSYDLKPSADYEVTLECLEKVTYTSGSKTRTRTTCLWKSQQKLRPQLYRSSSGIPIKFSIPASCVGIYDSRAKGSISWSLTIDAPTPGLNFHAKFDMPVYAQDQGD